MTTIDDEDGARDAQEGARRDFATDFGFVRRLVRILGRDAIKPEGRDEIGRWLTLTIDGADRVLDAAIEHDAMSAEVVALANEVEEARTWVADFLKPGETG
jgi:hypothetical protein